MQINLSQILSHYPTPKALGGGVICASIALEKALRAIKDLGTIDQEESRKNFSANLASAFCLGICAANILPGSAFVGAVLCLAYSYIEPQTSSLTMQVYGTVLRTLVEYTVEPLWNHIVYPLGKGVVEHIIFPLAKTIRKIAAAIFNVVRLPPNAGWFVLAALVVAIVAYRGLPGVSFQSPIHFQR